jgi:polyribonucleotide nucleotidyltransferase
MKIVLALIVGIVVGATAVWFYHTSRGRSAVHAAGEGIVSAGKTARDTVQEKIRVLELRPEQIKDDLAKTGRVVRRKARETGQAIADATADARVTMAIKTKLAASRELSALSISVNTTGGIVTLSGTVPTAEAITKAMLLAMETDGVSEVISTLQVRPPAKKG